MLIGAVGNFLYVLGEAVLGFKLQLLGAVGNFVYVLGVAVLGFVLQLLGAGGGFVFILQLLGAGWGFVLGSGKELSMVFNLAVLAVEKKTSK